MTTTADDKGLVCDSGLCGLPEPMQKALEFAARRADETCELISGETCLYWALVYTVNQHRKDLQP